MAAVDVSFFRQPHLPLRPWLLAELRRFADDLALPVLASVAVAVMYQARWHPAANSYAISSSSFSTSGCRPRSPSPPTPENSTNRCSPRC